MQSAPVRKQVSLDEGEGYGPPKTLLKIRRTHMSHVPAKRPPLKEKRREPTVYCHVHIVGPKEGVETLKSFPINKSLRSAFMDGMVTRPSNPFDFWCDKTVRLLNCQKTFAELGIDKQPKYRIRIVERNRSVIVDDFLMSIRRSVPDELDEDPSDDKKPLSSVIKELSTDSEYVKNFVLRIAKAVKLLHDSEIMHLGLGLDSIVVSDSGTPYLSKLEYMESVKQCEAIKLIAYDVPCMAPEILSKRTGVGPPVGLKMDIYAFGAILYQLVTHTIIEEGSKDLYFFAKSVFLGKNWIETAPCDSKYRDLIVRCLDHNPDNRPSIDDCISIIHGLPN